MVPPADLAGWVAAIEARPCPVLASTSASIDDWRQNEDAVDAHLLTQSIAFDPLMTVKLLRHVAAARRGRGTTDAETVTEALVMLGITPFFRAFPEGALTVEDWLGDEPPALAGFEAVLRRSQRAASFALAFAIHLQDHDAAVIHEAALLHDFAELLLWAHAPAMAADIVRRQAAEPGLRSVEAQTQVLGLPLSILQHALMRRWCLPALLIQLDDDHSAALRQVRTVNLAVRLARHSAAHWHNPALPDDLNDLARLLNLSAEHVLALVRDIDA